MNKINDRVIGNRRLSIEILRFFACFGIVWFHADAPGKHFAYSGLPVFMILSVSFVLFSKLGEGALLKKYFHKLIYPWFFWSGIYAIFEIMKSIYLGRGLFDKFHISMFLVGTSIHLWYLFYAFMNISVIIILRYRYKYFLNLKSNFICALISGISLLILSIFFLNLPRVIPFNQWLFLFPAIPIGLFFSQKIKSTKVTYKYYFGLGFLIICCIIPFLLNWKGLAIYYLIAIIGCFFAFMFEKPANKLIVKVSSLTYGIYLIHPLIITIFVLLGIRNKSFEIIIISFMTSLFITYIIQKTPFKKFI